jgi:hypothetical protein
VISSANANAANCPFTARPNSSMPDSFSRSCRAVLQRSPRLSAVYHFCMTCLCSQTFRRTSPLKKLVRAMKRTTGALPIKAVRLGLPLCHAPVIDFGPLMRRLRIFDALNNSTRRGKIGTASPVFGLRPILSPLLCTTKEPKDAIHGFTAFKTVDDFFEH